MFSRYHTNNKINMTLEEHKVNSHHQTYHHFLPTIVVIHHIIFVPIRHDGGDITRLGDHVVDSVRSSRRHWKVVALRATICFRRVRHDECDSRRIIETTIKGCSEENKQTASLLV